MKDTWKYVGSDSYKYLLMNLLWDNLVVCVVQLNSAQVWQCVSTVSIVICLKIIQLPLWLIDSQSLAYVRAIGDHFWATFLVVWARRIGGGSSQRDNSRWLAVELAESMYKKHLAKFIQPRPLGQRLFISISYIS